MRPCCQRTRNNPSKPYSGRVTNGAIVIHTQRLKSDPGGNLLS
ncbi:glutathione S-transferase [Escherichia coli]|nr:glutathione S-transferase [Escherichia coli]EFO1447887.1 glutathione S-transferase [Escherichia coli]RBJ22498.1 glutathione S-transferase [Escherichia coli]